ncbi:MAG: response regulator transcription factor [Alphaproteobacteria bacterium]|nr:response regulator transcription factor [Alphaproteobacteria bacterium]
MKILIIDDHALFRQGVAMILREFYPDSSIVEAATATEAIDAGNSHPDIRLVLGEFSLEDGFDFRALTRLVKLLPEAAIAVVSESEDPRDISGSFRAGAKGYIVKSSSCDTLRHALPLILAGEAFIPSSAIGMLTNGQSAERKRGAAPITGPALTPRQHEILLLMAQGMQNKDIASELGMLEGTVKVHVKSILQKLGVNNRTHAVVTGIRQGLVPTSLILPDRETCE